MPEYATAEQTAAYKSPEPLTEDFTHPETGLVYRIQGVCRARDKKPITENMVLLRDTSAAISVQVGYKIEITDIRDAAWCAACVVSPKLTSLQWLHFGIEADLWALACRCLVASREIKDPNSEEIDAPTGQENKDGIPETAKRQSLPDGVEAAENEIEKCPLV